jgi:hypothetical protein
VNDALTLTRRHVFLAWIALSACLAIVGAVGPWFTVSTIFGSLSLSGTYIGSNAGGAAFGAGWEVIACAIVAAVAAILGLRRGTRGVLVIAASAAALAAAEAGYVMVRSASALLDSSEYATASWGWGLIVALLASVSLTAAALVAGVQSDVDRRAGVDAPTRRNRAVSTLAVLLVLAIGAAAAEGAAIVHDQSQLQTARADLAAANEKIDGIPAQVSEARQTGYTEGTDEASQRYSSCYSTAYRDGYYEGWKAAVDELNVIGYVEGGSTDSWWDPTTFKSCDTVGA